MLDARDSNGGFISGIQPDQVHILENGTALPLTSLNELTTGVQVVFAINPGPEFGIRNSQAISRYDRLKEAIRDWANNRMGSTIDDMSLIITNGPSISHNDNPKELLATLDADEINPRNAIPNIDTLFHAVRLAGDQPDHPGMGRTVLFITTSPGDQIDQSLENLFLLAKEQGIQINVWMVSSSGTFLTQSEKELLTLVENTGGNFYTFSDIKELPNPEEYLNPLRQIYSAEYQSKIRSSGTHEIIAEIQIETDQILTNPLGFETNLIPPQPAFISPPIEIVINPLIGNEGEITRKTQSVDASEFRALSSEKINAFSRKQELQVVYDFPDGRKRPLVETSLLVDGEVVEQNLQPPFDQFTWSLEEFTSDGTHLIQVQAKDSLGLVGTSIEIPVRVDVMESSPETSNPIRENLPIIIGLAVIIIGAILSLSLIAKGKLNPHTMKSSMSRKPRTYQIKQQSQIQDEPSSRRFASRIKHKQHAQSPKGSTSIASLVCVSDSDEFPTTPPIPITVDDMTIGSGHGHVTLELNDPSIEPVHARLKRRIDGSFYLYDEGSVAGTWINYNPVFKEGNKLEHGDLIYIGRVGFRFVLQQPSQTRKLVLSENHNINSSTTEQNS